MTTHMPWILAHSDTGTMFRKWGSSIVPMLYNIVCLQRIENLSKNTSQIAIPPTYQTQQRIGGISESQYRNAMKWKTIITIYVSKCSSKVIIFVISTIWNNERKKSIPWKSGNTISISITLWIQKKKKIRAKNFKISLRCQRSHE